MRRPGSAPARPRLLPSQSAGPTTSARRPPTRSTGADATGRGVLGTADSRSDVPTGARGSTSNQRTTREVRPVTFARNAKIALTAILVLCLAGGTALIVIARTGIVATRAVAYFENSNGIYAGDDVMILGVAVGKIDKIEPEPMQTKVSF